MKIITITGLKRMAKRGWKLTRMQQIVDGVAYWAVQNDAVCETRYIPRDDVCRADLPDSIIE
jgi:hypothetical protein